MWYFLALIALLLVGILDGHFSSIAAMFLLFILGAVSVNTIKNPAGRVNGGKVFGAVFSIYVISAFIASLSFQNGLHFYVVDPVEYIETYSSCQSWSWDNTLSILSQTYLDFADNNGLFNESLGFWAYVGNVYFDGASVLYLTLFQTLFGVLALLEIYKIFLLYFEPLKSVKYAVIFAVLSLFHIYSIVIIRDIVIAYFYMLGLRVIMEKPKLSDLIILLLVMLATVGVRLYTGLFFGAFIMFWLYKLLRNKRYASMNIILVPIVILGVVFVGGAFLSSVLIENTTGQIEEYDVLYSQTSGFATRLRSLPIGVREIAILLFTQLPLDGLNVLLTVNSFPNFYLALLVFIYQIFGFVIFYGLLYYCFFKGYFKKLTLENKLLLIIILLFIAITLSTHIDIRRSMEAIPFIFLLYMLCPICYKEAGWHKLNRTLIAIGLLLMITYTIVF